MPLCTYGQSCWSRERPTYWDMPLCSGFTLRVIWQPGRTHAGSLQCMPPIICWSLNYCMSVFLLLLFPSSLLDNLLRDNYHWHIIGSFSYISTAILSRLKGTDQCTLLNMYHALISFCNQLSKLNMPCRDTTLYNLCSWCVLCCIQEIKECPTLRNPLTEISSAGYTCWLFIHSYA